MILQLVYTLIFSTNLQLHSKPQIQANSVIEITYGSSPWNKNKDKKDTAFLFVQDRNTKKTVKIFLEETASDSSIFKGKFSLSINSDKKFAPAIYIPPMNLRTVKANDSFYKLLKQKKVKRRPIVYKNDTPYSKLEVFDTREQAKLAVQSLKKEYLAKKQKTKIKADKLSVSKDKQMLLNELAIKSAKQEMDRLRLAQLEKQKIQERIEKQKKLKRARIEEQKNKAQELANKALEFYKEGNYPEAEKLFKQSTELDPENTSYYFKYGVSLYRNKKYNEALVIFDLVTNQTPSEELEKRYYMALIHYKLEELDQAIEQFNFVKTQNHPVLSPSSAFYNGVIQFGKETYDQSKLNFEYVLDTSKDPKMDDKAEEFIEKIARIQQFKAQQSLKNTVTGLVGVGYDSNVLNSPDNTSQGTATDVATPRLMALGSYERRIVHELKHEFSAKLTSLYMYSLDDDAVPADPFLITAQLPYSYKAKLFNKGYKLTLTPGYESLFMDVQSTGTRSQILGSMTLNINNTFIMSNKWQAQYILDVRQDDSLLSETSSDDNADALKYSIKTNQYYFLSKNKKTAYSGGLGYTVNDATGENKAYNRIDLSIGYMSYYKKWDTSYNVNLNTYSLNYDGSDSREETNYALTFTFNKPIKDWFIGSTNLNYTKNDSSSESYTYSKYTIMFNAIFNYSF